MLYLGIILHSYEICNEGDTEEKRADADPRPIRD